MLLHTKNISYDADLADVVVEELAPDALHLAAELEVCQVPAVNLRHKMSKGQSNKILILAYAR